MKASPYIALAIVVAAAAQAVACSSSFRPCEETRTCGANGGIDSGADASSDAGDSSTVGGSSAATGGHVDSAAGAPGDDGGISGGAGGQGGTLGEGGAANGEGGVAGTDDGTVPNGGGPTVGATVGVLNAPCAPEGAYGCAGHAQKGQLVCSHGQWATNGTCTSGNNCDTRAGSSAGSCAPILSQCTAPGTAYCTSSSANKCDVDQISVSTTACAGTTPQCLGGSCVACLAPALQCADASHTQSCSATGAWQTATACAGGFCNGAGICGVCKAGSHQCTATGPETCLANGTWSTPTVCGAATPVCNTTTFTCTPRPSCTGLSATCGIANTDDCCASTTVPAGDFYRSYDASTFTSEAYPATLSAFRLDTYEITVGRFRKFVAAYAQNMTATGAGKNPNNAADTGWAAAWNSSLSVDAASLKTALQCGGGTWTNAVGTASAESLPISCLDWYDAEAFCIWDGGRLPTEAEWNYAASGGIGEQRIYPWGNTSPGASASFAVYGCYFSSTPGSCTGGPSNFAPVGYASAGHGKWGQMDLAGNATEWVADGYGTYPVPCTNCEGTSLSVGRVQRGGSFLGDASTITSSVRDVQSPGYRYTTFGARCARLP